MKNKTLAAGLALVLGPLGVHRMYLYGLTDWVAWLHPIPTALGIYGLQRLSTLGQDDMWSWVLIPLLGFTFSITALHAIVYGLMSPEKWNRWMNPSAAESIESGATGWLTVGTVVLALLIGTTVLMASIVISFQHYFEHQIQEARKISQ